MNLFDATMQFQMPSDAELSALPKEAQQRFAAVRQAHAKLTEAIRHRENVEARTQQNIADRAANADELKKLAPKWTPTDEVRAFIRSEREQRQREGY